jgi:acetyl esterase/lipase
MDLSRNRLSGIVAWFIAATVCAVAARAAVSAEETDPPKQTVVYKTVGPTRIEADVFAPRGDEPRPVVIWIHGGALIMGSREGVPRNLRQLCRERNYGLVSIDYRLAPEVKLPAIIDDLKDFFRWLAADGTTRFHFDPARCVVAGGSAGGYLTLMSGLVATPRPKALVAYWGYGDVDGPWYITPSAHYRKSPLVNHDDALRAVGGEVKTGSGGSPRGTYYLYLRQNGLWCREVTGFDPETQRKELDAYCPVRNITRDYPPTFMIHGTDDTDVPYQESADMAAALAAQGVPHELFTVERGGHGLGGGDENVVAEGQARALAFVRAHLE